MSHQEYKQQRKIELTPSRIKSTIFLKNVLNTQFLFKKMCIQFGLVLAHFYVAVYIYNIYIYSIYIYIYEYKGLKFLS